MARRGVVGRRSGTPSYGIDAPGVVPGFGSGAVACAAAAQLVPAIRRNRALHRSLWCAAVAQGVVLANFLHGTLRGKFAVWDAELAALDLRGDETVVDLGCGRGAVLLAAAARLPHGRALGVDLWRGVDQSGNRPAATTANAGALGVADRIELRTADLTEVPLPTGCADVVLSSLVFHNIHDRGARAAALREAVRVLRPGGRLVVADLAHVREYARILTASGMTGVVHRSTGWSLWWGIPRVLSATKPDPEPARSNTEEVPGSGPSLSPSPGAGGAGRAAR